MEQEDYAARIDFLYSSLATKNEVIKKLRRENKFATQIHETFKKKSIRTENAKDELHAQKNLKDLEDQKTELEKQHNTQLNQLREDAEKDKSKLKEELDEKEKQIQDQRDQNGAQREQLNLQQEQIDKLSADKMSLEY